MSRGSDEVALPLHAWHGPDAAFALGTFSRSIGSDVLLKLTLCDGLELSDRHAASLQRVVDRIEQEARNWDVSSVIDAVPGKLWSSKDIAGLSFEVDLLDRGQVESICDAAMQDSRHRAWYELGVAYGEFIESVDDRNQRGNADLRHHLLSSIADFSRDGEEGRTPDALQQLADELRSRKHLLTILQAILPEYPDSRHMNAQALLDSALEWCMVQLVGHQIRQFATEVPSNSFPAGYEGLEPIAQTGKVVLFTLDVGPLINGQPVAPLRTKRAYDIVKAIMTAPEQSMTRADLERVSLYNWRTLKALSKHADWCSVFQMAGRAYQGGYRIL